MEKQTSNREPSASQPGSPPDNQQTATSVDQQGAKSTSGDAFDKNAFLVRFGEHDPDNPMNFSGPFKAWLTFELGLLALTGSVGSSIITPAEATLSIYLDISVEATVLTLALFVLGYALGPILWGPLSEVYGRRWSILPGVFVLGILSIGTARSKNAAGVLVTRFLGGVFGSAPISNATAALGDFYPPRTRGVPMAFMALCVIGGPTVGPIAGAALTSSRHLGWRWTEYIEAIFAFFVFAVALFGLPETYAPVLLKRKAKATRKASGDPRYWHPQESAKITPSNVVTKHLSRPLRMLFTEPIVTCISSYASFVYGLLFLTLEVFPLVFQQHRGYGPVVSTLPFLALLVGVVFALVVNIANQPVYARAVKRNNGRAAPQARLPPMIIGGLMFTAGIFWFGWTAAPRYPWPLSVVAAGFIGAGFNIVFQQCLNFLVDVYGPYAASAVSANNLLRCLMACGLPLAARPMFLNLGVGPAASILGGISCLALPVPWIFMKYGRKLQAMSKFAQKLED